MKKVIITCLIALCSVPVVAEWVLVETNEMGSVYIDPATVRKDGDMRKVWSVSDFKKRGKGGEMSARARFEYNCKEERFALMSGSTHSGAMLAGKTLTNLNLTGIEQWDDVAPGTVNDAMMKMVCEK
jgi:hypothetical protein